MAQYQTRKTKIEANDFSPVGPALGMCNNPACMLSHLGHYHDREGVAYPVNPGDVMIFEIKTGRKVAVPRHVFEFFVGKAADAGMRGEPCDGQLFIPEALPPAEVDRLAAKGVRVMPADIQTAAYEAKALEVKAPNVEMQEPVRGADSWTYEVAGERVVSETPWVQAHEIICRFAGWDSAWWKMYRPGLDGERVEVVPVGGIGLDADPARNRFWAERVKVSTEPGGMPATCTSIDTPRPQFAVVAEDGAGERLVALAEKAERERIAQIIEIRGHCIEFEAGCDLPLDHTFPHKNFDTGITWQPGEPSANDRLPAIVAPVASDVS